MCDLFVVRGFFINCLNYTEPQPLLFESTLKELEKSET